MLSKTSMFLFSCLVAGASSFAHADTTVSVQSEVVRYDDLRLISAVGAAVLYGRLRGAAERACGAPLDARQINLEPRFRTCVNDAIGKAVAQVNQPVLTAYHESVRNRANTSTASTPNGSTVAKAK